MCASYGLDPHTDVEGWQEHVDDVALRAVLAWAAENGGATIRPTGIRARNLAPLITQDGFTEAWWGHLVDGKAARYPSINSRIERLSAWRRPLSTAIAPASYWREFQKPSKRLHHLSGGGMLGLAAVTQAGVHEDGTEYVCYSLVMRPAAAHIEAVHDRMPLLIPAGFADEWLSSGAPAGELLDAALAASETVAEKITATPQADRSQLF